VDRGQCRTTAVDRSGVVDAVIRTVGMLVLQEIEDVETNRLTAE